MTTNQDNPAFEMHFFIDRYGQRCVSTTDTDGRKTPAVVSEDLYHIAKSEHDYLRALKKGKSHG